MHPRNSTIAAPDDAPTGSLQKIRASGRQLHQLPREIKDLDDRIQNQRAHLAAHEESYAINQIHGIPAKIQAFEADIVSEQKEIAELDSQMQPLQNEVNALAAELSRIRTLLAPLEEKQQLMNQWNQSIRTFQTTIQHNQMKMAANAETIRDLERRLEAIPGEIRHHQYWIDRGLYPDSSNSSYYQAHKDVRQCRHNLSHYPQQIKALTLNNQNLLQEISQLQTTIQTSLTMLSQVSNQLTVFDVRTQCMRDMTDLRNACDNQTAQHLHHENRYDALQKKRQQLATHITKKKAAIAELHQQRTQYSHKITMHLKPVNRDTNLLAEEKTLLDTLDNTKKHIQTLETEKTQKTVQLNQLKSIALIAEPERCAQAFAARMIAAFQLFEEQHPGQQPDEVRLCLLDVENKINFILQGASVPRRQLERKPDQNDANEFFREAYYCLRGMLALFKAQMPAQTAPYATFYTLLTDLAQDNAVNSPIGKVDDTECQSVYQKLLEDIPACRLLDKVALYRQEEARFDQAHSRLGQTIDALKRLPNPPEKVIEHASKVSAAIQENKPKELTTRHQRKEVKLYTRTLDQLSGFMQKKYLTPEAPATQADHEKFATDFSVTLSAHQTEKHATCKKWLGAALMLCGALTIGVCAGFGFTGGLGIAAGSVLFITGALLMRSGQTRNLRTALTHLRDEVSAPVKPDAGPDAHQIPLLSDPAEEPDVSYITPPGGARI